MMTSQAVEETWICTGGYGRFRGKMVKLDLVKITLEGNPKMRDHADK